MTARFEPGPWGFAPIAVHECLCPDGKRRYARLTGTADTFFSIPASVKVQGKSVSGFVTTVEGSDPVDYEFHANSWGKNACLFKQEEEDDEEQRCCICGKNWINPENQCECVCPICHKSCFNDSTVPDHGMCYDCHKKWQHGELKITEDE